MKTKLLSLAAAALITAGVAGTANTAAADTAANAIVPAVATTDANTQATNVGFRLRIRHGFRHRHGYGHGYGYGHRYLGSYRHCRSLLYRWKAYGSLIARHQFYRFGCGRYYY